VALCGGAVLPDGTWIWEAVRLTELHPSVGVCGGRVVSWRGDVRQGCRVLDAGGALVDPFVGRSAADPGPFALALKPHQVASASPDIFIADTALLRAALRSADSTLRFGDLATRLSAWAWTSGRAVVYSPLVSARGSDRTGGARQSAAGKGMERQLRRALGTRRLGLAGFLRATGLTDQRR
jgi:hypothetical protein